MRRGGGPRSGGYGYGIGGGAGAGGGGGGGDGGGRRYGSSRPRRSVPPPPPPPPMPTSSHHHRPAIPPRVSPRLRGALLKAGLFAGGTVLIVGSFLGVGNLGSIDLGNEFGGTVHNLEGIVRNFERKLEDGTVSALRAAAAGEKTAGRAAVGAVLSGREFLMGRKNDNNHVRRDEESSPPSENSAASAAGGGGSTNGSAGRRGGAGAVGGPNHEPTGPALGPSLARGVSGLPASHTPALAGASRGRISCDGVNVDDLAYWNDPQGRRDEEFRSPFVVGGGGGDSSSKADEGGKGASGGTVETTTGGATGGETETKYLTFQPDSGGWNNVRMSLEIVFIFALATGRTLVLPPPMPMYRLDGGDAAGATGPGGGGGGGGGGSSKDPASPAKRRRGFGNFYPLHKEKFRRRIRIITTEEFLEKEGMDGGRFPVPKDGNRTAVLRAGKACDHRKKSGAFCDTLYEYLKTVGTVPDYTGKDACFIFDENKFWGGEMGKTERKRAEEFCGRERTPFYVDSKLQDAPIIHFRSSERHHRLVQHFYGAVLFTNPAVDNYFKRFVRDFLHYHDSIYCAAGKIVRAVQEEGRKRGFDPDRDGAGGYSSLHVRRGDLQYKKVKISAEEWYDNTREVWLPNEVLYVATDERNKTWFDPIRRHHTVRFLDDYWDQAGLSDLDPNYVGMIDTIVASRGRAFAGTFFSTFSGFINRMRGYHGMTMNNSYYSFLPRKYEMHEWHRGPNHIFSHEWPTGWVGIDGDVIPSQDLF